MILHAGDINVEVDHKLKSGYLTYSSSNIYLGVLSTG